MKKRLLRSGLGLIVLMALSLAAGSIYEFCGKQRAESRFPSQGRLVDIGGRRIQLDCRGTGHPTVVFESGLDIYGSLSWSSVQEEVARTTRACTYSRAGIMWSDTSPKAHDGKAIADDLHLTLTHAGEQGPFVLVGHSLGGPYITIYTRYFGSEVAGLVFVDASHPEQEQRLSAAWMNTSSRLMQLRDRAGAALAWAGVVRGVVASFHLPLKTLHDEEAVKAYASTSIRAMLEETEAKEQTLAEAGAFRQFGARPLVVLTGMALWPPEARSALGISLEQARQWQEAWKKMHDEQASWSSQGQHVLVPDAGHYIQLDHPDAVVRAIRTVVAKVRGNER